MSVVSCKTEIAYLESKTLQFMESTRTGINVGLFWKQLNRFSITRIYDL